MIMIILCSTFGFVAAVACFATWSAAGLALLSTLTLSQC